MKSAARIIFLSLFTFFLMLSPKEAEANFYKNTQLTQIAWLVSIMAFIYPALYLQGVSKNPGLTPQCPDWFLLAYCDPNIDHCVTPREDGKAAVCINPDANKNATQFPVYVKAGRQNVLAIPLLIIAGVFSSVASAVLFCCRL